jgi:hypothetical protein
MTAGPTFDDRAARRPRADAAHRYFALHPQLRAKRAVLSGLRESTFATTKRLMDRIRELRAEREGKKAWIAQAKAGALTGSAGSPSPDQLREIGQTSRPTASGTMASSTGSSSR